MHRTLRNRLENVFPKLKGDLVFANIAAPLIQHSLITDDEYEAVLALNNEDDRSEALFDFLSGKTDSAFYTFLEIIKVNHPWIMDEIYKKSVDDDVVDGVILPCPKPVIISRNDLRDEKGNTSASSLKRGSLQRCNSAEEPPSAKRRSNPVKSQTKTVNKRSSDTQKNGEDENCKCAQIRCTSSDPVRRENESRQISNTNADENNAKLAQGVSEEMMRIVKKNYRVCTRWTSLAHSLGLSAYVDKIQFKVMIHNEDLDLRVVYLLREWVGERSKEATLNNLLTALRTEAFNDVADELEEKFSM